MNIDDDCMFAGLLESSQLGRVSFREELKGLVDLVGSFALLGVVLKKSYCSKRNICAMRQKCAGDLGTEGLQLLIPVRLEMKVLPKKHSDLS